MLRVTPMPPAARARFDSSLTDADAFIAGGRPGEAWPLHETAHILSQPWWRPHVRTHWLMLRLAVRTRDRREVTGQLLRLVVAGPGSATGRYPKGNTGRADVPATLPMPVPDDLTALLTPDRARPAGTGRASI
jgi:hypothetical protein